MGEAKDAGVVRTPEERFEGLPDFPFEPQYAEVDGLRLAYIDEGQGLPVVFFHGEPTWSYLWRHVMPPVCESGFRCIAPDLPGFGRSDKPTDIDWYTYDRHYEMLEELLAGLGLSEAIAVMHDWGGPIGMRLAVDHPEWFARLVIMETGPFTGQQTMSEAWLTFRDFVANTEDLPVGMLVRGGCHTDPGDEVIAAYEAPYPNPESKAGARAFPAILPTTPEAPGAEHGRRIADALRGDSRPALVMWADSDPVLPLSLGEKVSENLNFPPPQIVKGASHFLQEDKGREIGETIAEWLNERD